LDDSGIRFVAFEMSVLVPDEIPEVLKKTNGYSLLVKGSPGMGKSTLALTLMVEKANVSGFYVSTRVKPDKLFEQFPWARKYVKVENIVDATDLITGASSSALDTEGEFQLLKDIKGRVDGLQDPTVIIDTWDAVHTTLGDSAISTEKKLTDWPRDKNLTLVLISEFMDARVLEFLVDGIITLTDTEIGGRRVREARLDKLREWEIKSLRYVYTLKNGIFRRFPPLKIRDPEEPQPWIPFSDEKCPFYSGSQELDEAVAENLRGGCVMLEMRDNVPFDWANLVVRPFVLNFMAKDRGVLMVPPSELAPEQIQRDLVRYVTEEKFETYATIFASAVGSESLSYVLDTSRESEEDENKIWLRVEEEKRGESRGPMLRLLNVDRLEHSFGVPRTLRKCANQVARAKLGEDLMILVTRSTLGSTRQLRSMCDIDLKMIDRYGACYIYGDKPRTGLFNVDLDISEGFPVPKLTPVV
jgi:KaiC/GvpD/RAD55 family RecA-like ATPase